MVLIIRDFMDDKEDIFVKALRFLYEKRLEQIGVQADIIIIMKKEPSDNIEKEQAGD